MPVVGVQSLRLVTFGLGDTFDRSRFQPVKNRRHVKPSGGLWSSPVDARYGWREWCAAERFGDLSTRFETLYSGRTLVVNSAADLQHMIWQPQDSMHYAFSWPDYEALATAGINAIWLTERGHEETRFSTPGLYGYDRECLLVMNHNCLHANRLIKRPMQESSHVKMAETSS